MKVVKLKTGREKSLLHRHPWVFSGAIEEARGNPLPGETVGVLDSQGEFLAWGAYSPHSNIRVRVWSWNPEIEIDSSFFHNKILQALEYRKALFPKSETNALRIVYGESDGLPGLIVDRYTDTLVVQFLSSGAEYWRESIIEQLCDLTSLDKVFERSDVEVRSLEGLDSQKGPVKGVFHSTQLEIIENHMRFMVDINKGQKTGFYLDQRENRQFIRNIADGKKVLDCFSYTGGFTVSALLGGATAVTAIDASVEVWELFKINLQLNSLQTEQVDLLAGDVFYVLRSFRDRGQRFDLILLDPPKFAPTSLQIQKAARGYKDINLLAFKLLNAGGFLVTFSCSGGISMDLFQKIVTGAALDAGVEAQIVSYLHQARDHPPSLNFPEATYLKGLVLRVK